MMSVGFNYALGVLFPVLMESFNESRERTGKLNNLPSTLSSLFCLDPVGQLLRAMAVSAFNIKNAVKLEAVSSSGNQLMYGFFY